jgi:hypothetical protein
MVKRADCLCHYGVDRVEEFSFPSVLRGAPQQATITEEKVVNFVISKDYATPDRAGAGGMYHISRLVVVDSSGNETDATEKVDVGLMFPDEDPAKLRSYLAETFHTNESQLNVEEY